MPKYKLKKAALAVRGLDPDVIGSTFENIVKREGELTPRAVHLDAKPKSHPLHDYFEWDNKKCGDAYRDQQASYLIRAVVVVEDDSPKEIRAFVSVNASEEEEASKATYQPINVVMADPDMRNQVLRRALLELEAFKKKYGELKELAELIKVADQLLLEHSEKPEVVA